MTQKPLGWLGIVRLGLVQTALGAIVVLCTSTMNRVMVVELALPALLPGLLVGIHYALQLLRPRLGFGSDQGGRRTPWIVGGMVVLSAGGVLASLAISWMASHLAAGVLLAVLAFVLIGAGVGAAGTSLLVLLATRVAPERRAAAATIVWVMMIFGFILTTAVAGALLDPFSLQRLVVITAGVGLLAVCVTLLAVYGVESGCSAPDPKAAAKLPFRTALAEVWREPQARRFTIFIFVSMLAYSAQDLILEPFAGTVFAMSPGQSTQLASLQNSGVLLGMILVAIAGSAIGGRWLGSMRAWMIGGCLASAVALGGLTLAGMVGPAWPLKPTVFALGLSNGAFAVAAIGSMMAFASTGTQGREGVRIGLWGAAQAIAFGIGGFVGAAASDLTRYVFDSPGLAYALVFCCEAALFVFAALLAARLGTVPLPRADTRPLSRIEASSPQLGVVP